jgi:cytochrome c oxidase subunit 4
MMKTLVLVWSALMLLLAATTATSFVPLGAANAVLNILIAVAKTALVILYFMRLRHSIALLRLFAIVGLITLGFLFALSGADFIARNIDRSAWQHPQSGVSTG